MSRYFITGTDTGVGKTLSAAIMTLALKATYWKPIQSGLKDEMSDTDKVRELTALAANHFSPSSYSLQASLSPHHAAELEDIEINLARCELPSITGPLIVEGAGGVYVPLNENECILDLMKKLGLPIIIICRGTMGTLNHTLLTIDVLRQHKIPIHGLVFSGELNPDNQLTIEQWSGVKTLFTIPFFESISTDNIHRWVAKNQDKLSEALS